MGAVDKITVCGVTFSVHPVGTNYKDAPGVYAFLRDDPDGWDAIYIGETESLKDRLTTNLLRHHQYDCAVKKNGATHIATRLVTGGRKARLDLETKLRNAYSTPCNEQ